MDEIASKRVPKYNCFGSATTDLFTKYLPSTYMVIVNLGDDTETEKVVVMAKIDVYVGRLISRNA